MLLLQKGHRSEQRSAARKKAEIWNMKSTDFVVARDDLQQSKIIITELADADALPAEALAFYQSPEYAPIKAERDAAQEARMFVVDAG